jgi:hypothetical protein
VTNGLFNGEIIPAKNASLAGGATLTMEGFINGFDSSGSAAQFNVNVEEAGEYNVIVRYASTLRPGEQNTPRTLSLHVNGTKQGQVQFPNLANWEMWDFKAEVVRLNADENTIAFQFDPEDNGDVYLDSIMLSKHMEPENGTSVLRLLGIIALVVLSAYFVLALRFSRIKTKIPDSAK